MWKIFKRQGKTDTRLADIQLIVCDLDGTLLNDRGDVFDSTAELVSKLVARGINIVLSTGRSVHSALDVQQLLHLQTPCIALDGAHICTATGELIEQWNIDAQTRDILRQCCEGRDLSVSAVNAFEHCTYGRPYTPDHIQHERIELRCADSIYELFSTEALRYYFVASASEIETLEHVFRKDKFLSGYTISTRDSRRRPGLTILEFRPAKADKGTSLQWLLRTLNVSDRNVAVAGDYRNDVPMFRKSYYCVTLSNAVAELRSLADFICAQSSADGGIDEFFSTLLNIQS